MADPPKQPVEEPSKDAPADELFNDPKFHQHFDNLFDKFCKSYKYAKARADMVTELFDQLCKSLKLAEDILYLSGLHIPDVRSILERLENTEDPGNVHGKQETILRLENTLATLKTGYERDLVEVEKCKEALRAWKPEWKLSLEQKKLLAKLTK
ncbi:hypothetical protein E8E13_003141 [Curvularia kusanoi]|uniref:Uncharacterized protein n=1 Tax=Curvularia kusanoi TaxID=90978 RepID=A0A9P4W7B4_CURKU|nr:hypothetical protein E8E13_003141 [Curvularia kusanoi]